MAKIHSDLLKASKGLYIGGCIIMVLAAIPFMLSFLVDSHTERGGRMFYFVGLCSGFFIALLGKLIALFVDIAKDIKTIAQNYQTEPEEETELQIES